MTTPLGPMVPPSIHATGWLSEPALASAVLSRTGSREAVTASRSWPGARTGLPSRRAT